MRINLSDEFTIAGIASNEMLSRGLASAVCKLLIDKLKISLIGARCGDEKSQLGGSVITGRNEFFLSLHAGIRLFTGGTSPVRAPRRDVNPIGPHHRSGGFLGNIQVQRKSALGVGDGLRGRTRVHIVSGAERGKIDVRIGKRFAVQRDLTGNLGDLVRFSAASQAQDNRTACENDSSHRSFFRGKKTLYLENSDIKSARVIPLHAEAAAILVARNNLVIGNRGHVRKHIHIDVCVDRAD